MSLAGSQMLMLELRLPVSLGTQFLISRISGSVEGVNHSLYSIFCVVSYFTLEISRQKVLLALCLQSPAENDALLDLPHVWKGTGTTGRRHHLAGGVVTYPVGGVRALRDIQRLSQHERMAIFCFFWQDGIHDYC